jgi:hypothetical protein
MLGIGKRKYRSLDDRKVVAVSFSDKEGLRKALQAFAKDASNDEILVPGNHILVIAESNQKILDKHNIPYRSKSLNNPDEIFAEEQKMINRMTEATAL